MSASVRWFEHRDAPDLLCLYESVWRWFEEAEVSTEFIVKSSQRPDFRYLVAEDEGTVVGFCGALYFKAVGRAEYGPVAVAEGYRGAGVGSKLTDAMLGFLCENGVKRVVAKVKHSNDSAKSFFIKKGFSYEAYLRRYTLKAEDIVQMVRYL